MKITFKPKSTGKVLLLLGVLSLVTGCANLNTINRTTLLDSVDEKGKVIHGKAVHLDIQQRLLIVNAIGKYCSEPSPDALAAFTAAAGLGASSPAQGTLSATASGTSSVASIGLRTQSITLMRDALYRMCEAYGNGKLSGPQVMTMLSRSQDLTAVVLATEQLTGAVVAQQAALSGSASADATSVITATSQLLEAALRQQQRAEMRLEQAIKRKDDAEGKQKLSQEELAAAQTERQNNPGNDEAGQRASARLRKAERKLSEAEREVAFAENIRSLRKQTLEAATERVESLQAAQDSAATAAAASSSGSAVLSGGGNTSRLNGQSTQAIAEAVSKMVNNVVNKPYVLDYCMAIISADEDNAAIKSLQGHQGLCYEVILSAVKTEQIRVAGTSEVFDVDDMQTTNCIKSWLNSNAVNMGKLDQWRNQKADGVDHFTFMSGKSSTNLRSAAVDELSISCN